MARLIALTSYCITMWPARKATINMHTDEMAKKRPVLKQTCPSDFEMAIVYEFHLFVFGICIWCVLFVNRFE